VVADLQAHDAGARGGDDDFADRKGEWHGGLCYRRCP
jgi:hypothetical protein